MIKDWIDLQVEESHFCFGEEFFLEADERKREKFLKWAKEDLLFCDKDLLLEMLDKNIDNLQLHLQLCIRRIGKYMQKLLPGLGPRDEASGQDPTYLAFAEEAAKKREKEFSIGKLRPSKNAQRNAAYQAAAERKHLYDSLRDDQRDRKRSTEGLERLRSFRNRVEAEL